MGLLIVIHVGVMEGRPPHSNSFRSSFQIMSYRLMNNKMTLYGLTNLFQNVVILDVQS